MTMEMETRMPRYKTHKISTVVSALKIKSIEASGCSASFLIPEEDGHAPVEVSADYMAKNKPVVGGYYMRYAEGYESFCEAEIFERDTTRIED